MKNFQEIELFLPLQYNEDMVRKKIQKELKINDFEYMMVRKSLDARNKNRIGWKLRLAIFKEGKEKAILEQERLVIPFYPDFKKKKVAVIGLGPAGFFTALVLAYAGFEVVVFEQGKKVEERKKDIQAFEQKRIFHPFSNYCFGEGGAGAFSDGKLTSRTKTIDKEREWIFQTLVKHKAPEEILYLAHPHIGSDYLEKILPSLRLELLSLGVKIEWETRIVDFKIKNSKNIMLWDQKNASWEFDFVFFAIGHSDYETYRMLLKNGIAFQPKPFAIGMRAEHKRTLINLAQFGKEELPGVKAAEYRLTAQLKNKGSGYSFCMCPGGSVIPANATSHTSVVNGVSNYQRNGEFSNAAIVTTIDLKHLSVLENLQWVEDLEKKVFAIASNFDIPAIWIKDFLKRKCSSSLPHSSYPFGIFVYDIEKILPSFVVEALRETLFIFCQKLKRYEEGILLGVETKTSSPIQVVRDKKRHCINFENIYLIGEGSGWAGGIVSSAADGIKSAFSLMEQIKN